MDDVRDIPDFGTEVDNVYATGGESKVLADKDGSVRIATKEFENGRGVYFSGFRYNAQNTRMLYRAILWAAGNEQQIQYWTTDNFNTECAFFVNSRKLVDK